MAKSALAVTMLLLSMVIATSPAIAQESEGRVSGVVVGAGGRPLAGQRLELNGPFRERIVAITNTKGEFTYTRLRPGRYRVEWRLVGRVAARSSEINLSESMMHVGNVTFTLPQAKAFIDDLAEDAPVNVELLDGTKVRGHVRSTDEESFMVTDGFRTTAIAYDDVLKVRKGRSELTKFLIFVGLTTGISMAALVIAVVAAGGG